MKIQKRWWIVGGAVLLVLFFVIALVRPKPGREVQVAEARKQNLVAEVKAPGRIEAETQVNVSAEVPGRITHLAVQEGDVVKRGQLLLRLDDTNARQQMLQVEALLSAARARLRAAETAWQAAEPTYKRRVKLFEEKLLSPGEMEAAEREYQGALADQQAAQDEVRRQQAALRAARDQLSKMVYLSPIDGTVINLNVEAGEIVVIGTMNNPGTRILTVADLSRMVVKAEVDETDVVDVRVGQPARIEVDALPDTTFPGSVVRIGHSARNSGTSAAVGETDFEVEVLFDERAASVRPGMTADVEIETARGDSVLAVPIQAVVLRAEKDLEEAGKRGRRGRDEADASEPAASGRSRDVTGLFVVADGKAAFRRVATGIAGETDIQVSGEIQPGDQVITGPYNVLRDLKPGQAVKVEKEKRGRRNRS